MARVSLMSQVTSCVFDQTFFFDLPRMTRATLEAGAIALTVLDARFAMKRATRGGGGLAPVASRHHGSRCDMAY
jgi:hypothetical protein